MNLNFDMVASPIFVRFVYDGSSGSTGSSVVEDVFGDYFRARNLAYEPCYHAACDDIDNSSNTALSRFSDAAAHAVLTFAQTRSAVEGTDKGKALGHGEFQGSSRRR